MLAIGTNNLCAKEADPKLVHGDMLCFIGRIRDLLMKPRLVVLLPVLPRFAEGGTVRGQYVKFVQSSLDIFNQKARELNALNKAFALAHYYKYWEYNSVNMHLPSAYVEDGVQHNEVGRRRLVRGIKHCLMAIDRDWGSM